MVQAIVKLGENEDRMLTMIRGQFGLKNKSDTINFLIRRFGEELYEPRIRPEFAEKLLKLEREGTYYNYNSVDDLRKDIENETFPHRGKARKSTQKNSKKR